MNTNELIKKLTESDELKALIEKTVKESEVVFDADKMKIGDRYWYINGSGDIRKVKFEEDGVDIWNVELVNCYKTKVEALKAKKMIQIRTKLKKLALRLNNGVEINWGDGSRDKYCLFFDFNSRIEIAVRPNYVNKTEATIYCLSEDFKVEAIKLIGKEDLIEYLKS